MKHVGIPLLLGLLFAPLGSLIGSEPVVIDYHATAADLFPKEQGSWFKLGTYLFETLQPGSAANYRIRCDASGPLIVKDSSWSGWSATLWRSNNILKNAQKVCREELKKADVVRRATNEKTRLAEVARLDKDQEAKAKNEKEMFRGQCGAYFANPTAASWDLAPTTVRECRKLAQEQTASQTGQNKAVCREQIAVERGEAWILSREAGRLYRAKDYAAAQAKFKEASAALKRVRALGSAQTGSVKCVSETAYTYHPPEPPQAPSRLPAGAMSALDITD